MSGVVQCIWVATKWDKEHGGPHAIVADSENGMQSAPAEDVTNQDSIGSQKEWGNASGMYFV